MAGEFLHFLSYLYEPNIRPCLSCIRWKCKISQILLIFMMLKETDVRTDTEVWGGVNQIHITVQSGVFSDI